MRNKKIYARIIILIDEEIERIFAVDVVCVNFKTEAKNDLMFHLKEE